MMNATATAKTLRRILLIIPVVLASALWANSNELATLRNGDIAVEQDPPRMPEVENKDIKRARNYPMQPPTIPHKIDNYTVNLNANKCLSCHNRTLTEQSQAPMVSVTHFMNRDGNFLAQVSPRRYFCSQCHVTQVDAKPLVGNDFQDVDSLLSKPK